jgi:hypothetical protein
MIFDGPIKHRTYTFVMKDSITKGKFMEIIVKCVISKNDALYYNMMTCNHKTHRITRSLKVVPGISQSTKIDQHL